MPFGDKPFGMRDIKLTTLDGATQVDLPSSMKLGFKELVTTGEMRGDDTIVALVTIADGAEWSLEAGGISLEAYALMTGHTQVLAGVTPNQTNTFTAQAGQNYPYFKVYGKAVGENSTDDIHYLLYKCKLTEPLEGEFADGEFFVTKASGKAVTNGTKVYDVVQNETAADLPAT